MCAETKLMTHRPEPLSFAWRPFKAPALHSRPVDGLVYPAQCCLLGPGQLAGEVVLQSLALMLVEAWEYGAGRDRRQAGEVLPPARDTKLRPATLAKQRDRERQISSGTLLVLDETRGEPQLVVPIIRYEISTSA